MPVFREQGGEGGDELIAAADVDQAPIVSGTGKASPVLHNS